LFCLGAVVGDVASKQHCVHRASQAVEERQDAFRSGSRPLSAVQVKITDVCEQNHAATLPERRRSQGDPTAERR